jgi:hypothetical protein
MTRPAAGLAAKALAALRALVLSRKFRRLRISLDIRGLCTSLTVYRSEEDFR